MKKCSYVKASAFQSVKYLFSVFFLLSIQAWTAQAADSVYVKGAFDVNRLGASTYNIPIEIPPGTAGMQPSLSLTYNSQLANGLLGKGWSLAGLSVITRCGATQAQDGITSSVNLSSSDRFCLDGQKLVATAGPATYGNAGTEYRTELEAFSRVYAEGTAGSGPASFTVYTRSGQTLQYGTTTDSQILAQSNPNVAIWALHSVTDLNGNYYQISYYNDATTGQFYPTEIDYTGNTAASLTPYNSIKFSYATRPDQVPIYPTDVLMENYVRMTDIKTYEQGNLVLDYQLQYQLSGQTGNSLLTGVKVVGADGTTSLAPTTFGWNGPNGTYATSEGLPTNVLSNVQTLPANYIGGSGAGNSGSGIYSSEQMVLTGDFDGHGVTGFVQVQSGGTTIATCLSSYHGQAFNCTNYPIGVTFFTGTFLVGDFDGDGKMDVANISEDQNTAIVCYSNGGGSFSCMTRTLPSIWQSAGVGYFAADFDGDGRTDFIVIDPESSNNVEICLSQGRSADNICMNQTDSAFYYVGSGEQIADFDGDGRADVIHTQYDGSYNICYSNIPIGGSANLPFTCQNGQALSFHESSCTPPSGGTTTSCQTNVFIGDFNGDGKMDVAQIDFPNGKIGICNTIGRGVTPNCTTSSISSSWDFAGRIIVADFNGDGKTDILAVNGSSSQICYSEGNGTFNCTNITLPSGSQFYAGDFTGDGVTSILGYNYLGTSVGLLSTPPNYPDLLTSVTNGLGASTQLTYNPLTNGSIYTKGSSATYPTQDVQPSIYVVSSVQETNGIGGTHNVNYSYAQAQSDLEGRGFLGFGKVLSQDLTANQNFETDYNQVFPNTGLPSNAYKWIYNSSNVPVLVSQDTFTYGSTTFGSGPGATWVFPYKSQEVDSLFDPSAGFLMSSTTTQNTYDAYGNATAVNVTTNDGNSKARTNAFNNFTGSGGSSSIWYLGQLASIAQTNTNPFDETLTRTTQYTYSNSSYPNELTQEILQPGGSTTLSKSYTYDAFGNQISTSVTGTSLSARNASITFDSLGQFPVTITNAYSQSETQAHDPRFGTLTSSTDPNGLTTTWTYDLLGRRVSETRPDGVQTNVTFSSICSGTCYGQAYNIQVTKTGAPQITTYYDILDREYRRATVGFGSNTVWRYKSYDSVGRPLKVSRNVFSGNPIYMETFSYDNANRVISEVDFDGSSKSWYYNGLSTTTTNNNGQTRTEIRDSLGQLQQVTDADGHSTYYSYDPFGNLTTTTDPNGSQIALSYDVMGRKTGMVDPDAGTWSYTYNGAGEMLSQTDAKSQTTTMTYDNLGRLATRVSPEFMSTWTYDTATNGIGKLASVTNGSGYSKSYTYDSYGRPSTEQTTLDTTYTISTTYDSSSRVSQITYPTGFGVKYTYDSNGYLTEMDNTSTSAMYWKMTNANADTQPLQESFGNGLTSYKSYYGPTGLLNTVIVAPSSGSDVQNLSLSYDHLGNLIARTDLINSTSGGTLTETYLYDRLNRITGSVNPLNRESYSYDATGNLISKTDVGSYTYGKGTSGSPLHAVMVTSGPTSHSFTYDGDGNMTTGAGRTLTWNSFNKVASIQNSRNTVNFSYDANFERYKETETNCTDYQGNTSSTCTKYMINPRSDIGVHFEKETNGSITSYRHFLYAGPGNVVALYTSRSDGSISTRYFHKDHLGSIVLSTDENGNVAERLAYDAFGKRRNLIGTDDPNDLLKSVVSRQGFTGHEHLDDGGLGLIDMNGRVYDPLLGRFTSPDLFIQDASNLQSLNRYSYVLNNPTRLTDPSGYFSLGGFFSSIGHAIGSGLSAVAGFIRNQGAGNLGTASTVVFASALTGGAADAALLPAIGGLGAGAIAGAAAGAVAGGLNSALLGGGFSWQAVGMGAVAGGLGGGLGDISALVRPSNGIFASLGSVVGGSVAGAAVYSTAASLASGNWDWGSKFMNSFTTNLAISGAFYIGSLGAAEFLGGGIAQEGGNGFNGWVESNKSFSSSVTFGSATFFNGVDPLWDDADTDVDASQGNHEFGHTLQFFDISAISGAVGGSPGGTWRAYLGLGAWGLSSEIGLPTGGSLWENNASNLGNGVGGYGL